MSPTLRERQAPAPEEPTDAREGGDGPIAVWKALPPPVKAGLQVLAAFLVLYGGVELSFGRGSTGRLLGVPYYNGVPFGIILNGLVIGTLYALVAFGLILIYRANRLISFVQAGLGAVPGLLGLLLITRRGVPYPIAVLVMLLGAILTGFLVEFLIMRRFTKSPRLIATVATIGIAQILTLVEIFLPGWVGGSKFVESSFPTPFQGLKVEIEGVIFNGDYLAIVVVASAIMIGLGLFFRYTSIGIAVRASAENAERAALLGIPVRNVSTIVWIIAAICSAAAVFLRAPVVGLPAGGSISPLLLLYGLTAAIVAKMDSLPRALLAGMAIGVIDQSAVFGTSKTDLGAALMLPLILVALLTQKSLVGRAMDTGVSSFRALREFRPIPIELRNLPEVRRARVAGMVVIAAAVLLAPVVLGDIRANLLSLIVIYAMIAVSLVILSGWAGQISLGQFAFAGVGAAVGGGLAANHGIDFFVCLLAAGVAGAVIAVLIGLPALRVQGLFLAVVTLAFAATVQNIVLAPKYFGWLLPDPSKPVARPILYGTLDVRSDTAFYYVCLAMLVLAYLSARSLRTSRSGRVFIALRDNVRAGQSYGLNSSKSRLVAFGVSGFIAAVAGALLSFQQGAVDQGAFPLSQSIEVFIFTVVGGLTSLPGAILGAVYYTGLQSLGPALGFETLAALGTGVGVLLLLLLLPGGLAEGCFKLRDNALRKVAARRGIRVASLVADELEAPVTVPQDDDALRRAEEHIEHAEGRSDESTDAARSVKA